MAFAITGGNPGGFDYFTYNGSAPTTVTIATQSLHFEEGVKKKINYEQKGPYAVGGFYSSKSGKTSEEKNREIVKNLDTDEQKVGFWRNRTYEKYHLK